MQSCARVSFCSTALLDAIAAELVRGDLLNKISPNHLIDMIWRWQLLTTCQPPCLRGVPRKALVGMQPRKANLCFLIQHLCHVLSAIREARDVQQTGLQNSSLARLTKSSSGSEQRG